jgi:hypothetical protein
VEGFFWYLSLPQCDPVEPKRQRFNYGAQDVFGFPSPVTEDLAALRDVGPSHIARSSSTQQRCSFPWHFMANDNMMRLFGRQ